MEETFQEEISFESSEELLWETDEDYSIVNIELTDEDENEIKQSLNLKEDNKEAEILQQIDSPENIEKINEYYEVDNKRSLNNLNGDHKEAEILQQIHSPSENIEKLNEHSESDNK